MTQSIPQPLKWHGGKHYLAKRIVAMMPPHIHYVEPYAGGLSVLLAKDPEGVSEVVNDIDGELTNFWKVLQDPMQFAVFERRIQAMPFSESEWLDAVKKSSPVMNAINFFVRCRQSLAGRMDCFATLSRNRTRRGMNEQASAWLNAVDGLRAVHERLRGVVILNQPALGVIRSQDGPATLFYLDPPYLHETRESKEVYDNEMTESEHQELLRAVKQCRGKVVLSGYPSRLYEECLSDWNRHEFELPNNSAGGIRKRRMMECVWVNF